MSPSRAPSWPVFSYLFPHLPLFISLALPVVSIFFSHSSPVLFDCRVYFP